MRRRAYKCTDWTTGEKFILENPQWLDVDVFCYDGVLYRVIKDEGKEIMVVKLAYRFDYNFETGVKIIGKI